MKNVSRLGNVPKTSISEKPKEIKNLSFNLGVMVKNLMVAQLLAGIMTHAKKEELAQYFLGIVTGYADWLGALKVDEDTMYEVQRRLPKEAVKAEAEELAKRMLAAEEKKRRLVTGTALRGKEVAFAKRIFDERLKGELK